MLLLILEILFIAAILALGAAVMRLYRPARATFAPGAPGIRATAYAVGTLAAFLVL